jgi:hypothetical protein
MKFENLLPYWPALFIAGLLLTAVGIFVSWYRKRPSPLEMERRRRQSIAEIGKMGDGTITEVQEGLISYTYIVRGIEYVTSQDVSTLGTHLPAEGWSMIGPVSVKYDPRNPANSIVISEQWNGLRKV